MSRVLKIAQLALNFVIGMAGLLACSALGWLAERYLGVSAFHAGAGVAIVALWAHLCPLVTIEREDS